MTNKGIAWDIDIGSKFGKGGQNILSFPLFVKPTANYISDFKDTVKPENWPLPETNRTSDPYETDEELIVWMRSAALPSFKKLHRRVVSKGTFKNGLPEGQYNVNVQYCQFSQIF